MKLTQRLLLLHWTSSTFLAEEDCRVENICMSEQRILGKTSSLMCIEISSCETFQRRRL
jgi:hypothetical protein